MNKYMLLALLFGFANQLDAGHIVFENTTHQKVRVVIVDWDSIYYTLEIAGHSEHVHDWPGIESIEINGQKTEDIGSYHGTIVIYEENNKIKHRWEPGSQWPCTII